MSQIDRLVITTALFNCHKIKRNLNPLLKEESCSVDAFYNIKLIKQININYFHGFQQLFQRR